MKPIFGLIFLLLIDCSNEFNPVGAGPEFSLGTAFTATAGIVTSISGEQLTVQFVTVSEDARCPIDVQCVWSGNAKVGIRLAKADAGEQTIELNTHLQPQTTDYLSYQIQLVTLGPQRTSEGTIKNSDHKATLIIRKREAS